MITKLATFRGVSPTGEPLVRLFEPELHLTKEAGTLMPQVREWMASYKPHPDKIAILVNALGASEYWGQNVNGDIFPEASLVHDCRNHSGEAHPHDDFTGKPIPPYGYWTFLDAHPFVHHRNKDPNRALGHVALAVWNPKMHRVELIVIVDKKLALQHGGQDVVDRILAGEFPDVSMGTRVPYDVCSLCGHKSKTRNDYCTCLKELMGKILDDGRRVGMVNTYPRFFDISFVFIGADKTAKVMCKLGSGLWVPKSVADAETLYGPEINGPEGGLVKAAGAKDLSSVRDLFNNKIDANKTKKTRKGRRPIRADKLVKRAEEVSSVDEADTRLPMGRIDHQENPTAISDGALRTNAQAGDEEAPDADRSHDHSQPNRRGQIMDFYLGRARGEHPLPPGNEDRRKETEEHYSKEASTDPFVIKKSKISGQGAFADRDIDSGSELGTAFRKVKDTGNPDEDIVRDLLGKYVNHSSDPNLLLKIKEPKGEQCVVFAAKKQIKPGEELTVNYMEFPWEGERGFAKEATDTVFRRAKNIKIGPPPKPNRREYPFVGTIDFRGLTIHIENKPGDTRSGVGPTGKKWSTKMKLPYGEILGTRGTDKDKLDVYVGPFRNADNVYIIHQNHVGGRKSGKYDEDKVMLGFNSLEQAKEAYLAHYDSDKYLRSITTMAFPLFKKAVSSKEVHGEKVAAAWRAKVADLVMEDEFGVEKTAGCSREKESNFGLDDLFAGSATAQRRQRTWRDKSSGKETNVSGSGMGSFEKAKTASADIQLIKVARVVHHGWTPEQLLKVSNETKAAAHLKWADIVKRIGPSKAVGRVSGLLSDAEPELPKELLNALGKHASLECSLATPSLMGMVLKPQEFQRIVLIHLGKDDLADKLDEAGATFKDKEEGEAPCKELAPEHLDKKLLQALLPFLEDKSYVGPVVRRRIVRIVMKKPTPADGKSKESSSQRKQIEVDSPLLSKVASAYTWYRREVMKLASALPATVTNHPDLHAEVLGVSPEFAFSKTAAGELGLDRRSLALLLGTVPLSLLYSAHKRNQMRRGEDVGTLGSLVADHPWLTSMGVVTGLGALLRDPRAQQAVDEAFDAGHRIWEGKKSV